jgi:hypothetical protein
MKAQRVIVRDFMGRAAEKVVCSASHDKVFVTSESAYDRMEGGDRNVMPIGFDRADVFEHDPHFLAKPNWGKMRRWEP